jgi:hypothetical protein
MTFINKLTCFGFMLFFITFISCKNNSLQIVENIIPVKKNYEIDTYKYYLDKRMMLVLFKQKMTKDEFSEIKNSIPAVDNCFRNQIHIYRNMYPNQFMFDVSETDWWETIIHVESLYSGIYDEKTNKKVSCSENYTGRYSLAYFENYCYLIYERIIQ